MDIRISLEGHALTVGSETELQEGSSLYCAGMLGSYHVFYNRIFQKTIQNEKISAIFQEAIKQRDLAEQSTIAWKVQHVFTPLIDLTLTARNFLTAVCPYTSASPAVLGMRIFDGSVVMVGGTIAILRGINAYIAAKAIDDEMTAKLAALDILSGLFSVGSGTLMILLSAVFLVGEHVGFRLMKVLLATSIVFFISNLISLCSSIRQFVVLRAQYEELKTALETGRCDELLFKLKRNFVDDSSHDEKSLARLHAHAAQLIASEELRQCMQEGIETLKEDPSEAVELLNELLKDNIRQQTLVALSILLSTWGVAFNIVGLAAPVFSPMAWGISFAIFSCAAWLMLDYKPAANSVGNLGVQLAYSKIGGLGELYSQAKFQALPARSSINN